MITWAGFTETAPLLPWYRFYSIRIPAGHGMKIYMRCFAGDNRNYTLYIFTSDVYDRFIHSTMNGPDGCAHRFHGSFSFYARTSLKTGKFFRLSFCTAKMHPSLASCKSFRTLFFFFYLRENAWLALTCAVSPSSDGSGQYKLTVITSRICHVQHPSTPLLVWTIIVVIILAGPETSTGFTARIFSVVGMMLWNNKCAYLSEPPKSRRELGVEGLFTL